MLKRNVRKNVRPKRVFDVPGLGTIRAIEGGPGVVGRTSTIVFALNLVLSIAIWAVRAESMLVIALSCLLAFVDLVYLIAAFWYANKHPEFATLEGGSLVDYRKAQQAAKEAIIIDNDAPPIENLTPPKSLPRGEN
jgi:hypothetical protein